MRVRGRCRVRVRARLRVRGQQAVHLLPPVLVDRDAHLVRGRVRLRVGVRG